MKILRKLIGRYEVIYTNTKTIEWEFSFSDNSHIFGIPIRLSESIDAFMEIPCIVNGKRDLNVIREWIDKVAFLEEANLNFHFQYKAKGN